MKYRIVEKEAFFIAGVKKRIPLIYKGKNPHMDSMWASLTMDDFTELKQLSNVEPTGILCVSANPEGRTKRTFLAEGDYLDQYIGVATTKAVPEQWEILWNESPDTSKPDYKSELWIPKSKIPN